VTARLLVFNGSNRGGAWSGKLADCATRELALQGALPTRILLSDFPMPIMDEDLERDRGIPESATKLARLIGEHDGLLIVTPEYNGSIPPLLKNTIDWVTRVRLSGARGPRAFSGKPVGLCSSSTGGYAGIRAIGHLRAILSQIGCEVVAAQCSVGRAEQAFDANGDLREAQVQEHLQRVCKSLSAQATLAKMRE
jgi:NAD(P)H-dependent FMN reductase